MPEDCDSRSVAGNSTAQFENKDIAGSDLRNGQIDRFQIGDQSPAVAFVGR